MLDLSAFTNDEVGLFEQLIGKAALITRCTRREDPTMRVRPVRTIDLQGRTSSPGCTRMAEPTMRVVSPSTCSPRHRVRKPHRSAPAAARPCPGVAVAGGDDQIGRHSASRRCGSVGRMPSALGAPCAGGGYLPAARRELRCALTGTLLVVLVGRTHGTLYRPGASPGQDTGQDTWGGRPPAPAPHMRGRTRAYQQNARVIAEADRQKRIREICEMNRQAQHAANAFQVSA